VAILTYDPKLVNATLGGIVILGYADGKFIEIERNTDTFELTVGASGETARTQSNNRGAKATFTLLQSSISNDNLSSLAQLDELTAAGVGAFSVGDSGTTYVHAPNAWIKKFPKIERGKELSTVEWVIECDSLDVFAGGLTVL
jgi:hypothetical protein